MKRSPCGVVLLLLLAGCLGPACAGLPNLVASADPAERGAWTGRCQAVFAQEPFRAVHRIEADLPAGLHSDLLGVTLVDPAGRRFRAALISPEGLTLFDATQAEQTRQVHRAAPPLDDPDFGQGLLADVALALLPPEASQPFLGRRPDGQAACRYRSALGPVSDVLLGADQAPVRLERYDAGLDLVRRVEFGPAGPLGLAEWIELDAPGLAGYRLRLVLVQAEPVSPSDDLFLP